MIDRDTRESIVVALLSFLVLACIVTGVFTLVSGIKGGIVEDKQHCVVRYDVPHDITLTAADNREIFRIDKDGRFFVRGEYVETPAGFVDALCEVLGVPNPEKAPR
jgi:hypothetical protein